MTAGDLLEQGGKMNNFNANGFDITLDSCNNFCLSKQIDIAVTNGCFEISDNRILFLSIASYPYFP
jgi:hypothetical protein